MDRLRCLCLPDDVLMSSQSTYISFQNEPAQSFKCLINYNSVSPRLGVKRRERGGLCKSFELNQTCPINRKTTTSIADQSSIDQPLHNDLERSSLLLQPSREHEVSFSSIYSSNPSYESSGWCSRGQVVVRERARMEKIRGKSTYGIVLCDR